VQTGERRFAPVGVEIHPGGEQHELAHAARVRLAYRVLGQPLAHEQGTAQHARAIETVGGTRLRDLPLERLAEPAQ